MIAANKTSEEEEESEYWSQGWECKRGHNEGKAIANDVNISM